MTTIISGSGSADFETPLPVAEGGTGASTSIGSGGVMLSGQTGSAPVFGARAWCVFNGTTAGTNAPIAGGNVTSVTRNSAGDYTVNFTVAIPANSALVGTGGGGAGVNTYVYTVTSGTTTYRIVNTVAGTPSDSVGISVAFFG